MSDLLFESLTWSLNGPKIDSGFQSFVEARDQPWKRAGQSRERPQSSLDFQRTALVIFVDEYDGILIPTSIARIWQVIRPRVAFC